MSSFILYFKNGQIWPWSNFRSNSATNGWYHHQIPATCPKISVNCFCCWKNQWFRPVLTEPPHININNTLPLCVSILRGSPHLETACSKNAAQTSNPPVVRPCLRFFPGQPPHLPANNKQISPQNPSSLDCIPTKKTICMQRNAAWVCVAAGLCGEWFGGRVKVGVPELGDGSAHFWRRRRYPFCSCISDVLHCNSRVWSPWECCVWAEFEHVCTYFWCRRRVPFLYLIFDVLHCLWRV